MMTMNQMGQNKPGAVQWIHNVLPAYPLTTRGSVTTYYNSHVGVWWPVTSLVWRVWWQDMRLVDPKVVVTTDPVADTHCTGLSLSGWPGVESAHDNTQCGTSSHPLTSGPLTTLYNSDNTIVTTTTQVTGFNLCCTLLQCVPLRQCNSLNWL